VKDGDGDVDEDEYEDVKPPPKKRQRTVAKLASLTADSDDDYKL